MDNISKIGANANFYINNQSIKKESNAKKADDNDAKQNIAQNEPKDPNAIFDAMQMSAIQNKAVAFGKFVNPKDYLSEDRIKDIENSVGTFENNTENVKAAMDTEFKGVSAWENLPEAQKLALAANMQI